MKTPRLLIFNLFLIFLVRAFAEETTLYVSNNSKGDDSCSDQDNACTLITALGKQDLNEIVNVVLTENIEIIDSFRSMFNSENSHYFLSNTNNASIIFGNSERNGDGFESDKSINIYSINFYLKKINNQIFDQTDGELSINGIKADERSVGEDIPVVIGGIEEHYELYYSIIIIRNNGKLSLNIVKFQNLKFSLYSDIMGCAFINGSEYRKGEDGKYCYGSFSSVTFENIDNSINSLYYYYYFIINSNDNIENIKNNIYGISGLTMKGQGIANINNNEIDLYDGQTAYINITTSTCNENANCNVTEALNEAVTKNEEITVYIKSKDFIKENVFDHKLNKLTLNGCIAPSTESQIIVLNHSSFLSSSFSFSINNLIVYIEKEAEGNIFSKNGGGLYLCSVIIEGSRSNSYTKYSLIKVFNGGTINFDNVTITDIKFSGDYVYGAILSIDFINSSLLDDKFNIITGTLPTLSGVTTSDYSYGYYYLLFKKEQINGKKNSERRNDILAKINIFDGSDSVIYYGLYDDNNKYTNTYNLNSNDLTGIFVSGYGPFEDDSDKDCRSYEEEVKLCRSLSYAISKQLESNNYLLIINNTDLKENITIKESTDSNYVCYLCGFDKDINNSITVDNGGLYICRTTSIQSLTININTSPSKNVFLVKKGNILFDSVVIEGNNSNNVILRRSLIRVFSGLNLNMLNTTIKNIKFEEGSIQHGVALYYSCNDLDYDDILLSSRLIIKKVTFEIETSASKDNPGIIYLIFSSDFFGSLNDFAKKRKVRSTVKNVLESYYSKEYQVYFEASGVSPTDLYSLPGTVYLDSSSSCTSSELCTLEDALIELNGYRSNSLYIAKDTDVVNKITFEVSSSSRSYNIYNKDESNMYIKDGCFLVKIDIILIHLSVFIDTPPSGSVITASGRTAKISLRNVIMGGCANNMITVKDSLIKVIDRASISIISSVFQNIILNGEVEKFGGIFYIDRTGFSSNYYIYECSTFINTSVGGNCKASRFYVIANPSDSMQKIDEMFSTLSRLSGSNQGIVKINNENIDLYDSHHIGNSYIDEKDDFITCTKTATVKCNLFQALLEINQHCTSISSEYFTIKLLGDEEVLYNIGNIGLSYVLTKDSQSVVTLTLNGGYFESSSWSVSIIDLFVFIKKDPKENIFSFHEGELSLESVTIGGKDEAVILSHSLIYMSYSSKLRLNKVTFQYINFMNGDMEYHTVVYLYSNYGKEEDYYNYGTFVDVNFKYFENVGEYFGHYYYIKTPSDETIERFNTSFKGVTNLDSKNKVIVEINNVVYDLYNERTAYINDDDAVCKSSANCDLTQTLTESAGISKEIIVYVCKDDIFNNEEISFINYPFTLQNNEGVSQPTARFSCSSITSYQTMNINNLKITVYLDQSNPLLIQRSKTLTLNSVKFGGDNVIIELNCSFIKISDSGSAILKDITIQNFLLSYTSARTSVLDISFEESSLNEDNQFDTISGDKPVFKNVKRNVGDYYGSFYCLSFNNGQISGYNNLPSLLKEDIISKVPLVSDFKEKGEVIYYFNYNSYDLNEDDPEAFYVSDKASTSDNNNEKDCKATNDSESKLCKTLDYAVNRLCEYNELTLFIIESVCLDKSITIGKDIDYCSYENYISGYKYDNINKINVDKGRFVIQYRTVFQKITFEIVNAPSGNLISVSGSYIRIEDVIIGGTPYEQKIVTHSLIYVYNKSEVSFRSVVFQYVTLKGDDKNGACFYYDGIDNDYYIQFNNEYCRFINTKIEGNSKGSRYYIIVDENEEEEIINTYTEFLGLLSDSNQGIIVINGIETDMYNINSVKTAFIDSSDIFISCTKEEKCSLYIAFYEVYSKNTNIANINLVNDDEINSLICLRSYSNIVLSKDKDIEKNINITINGGCFDSSGYFTISNINVYIIKKPFYDDIDVSFIYQSKEVLSLINVTIGGKEDIIDIGDSLIKIFDGSLISLENVIFQNIKLNSGEIKKGTGIYIDGTEYEPDNITNKYSYGSFSNVTFNNVNIALPSKASFYYIRANVEDKLEDVKLAIKGLGTLTAKDQVIVGINGEDFDLFDNVVKETSYINITSSSCKSDSPCFLYNTLNEAVDLNEKSISIYLKDNDVLESSYSSFSSSNKEYIFVKDETLQNNPKVMLNRYRFEFYCKFEIKNIDFILIDNNNNNYNYNIFSQSGKEIKMDGVTIGGNEYPVHVCKSVVSITDGGIATFNKVTFRYIILTGSNEYGIAISYDYSQLKGSSGSPIPESFTGLTLTECSVEDTVSTSDNAKGVMILIFDSSQFTYISSVKKEVRKKITLPKEYFDIEEKVYYSIKSNSNGDLYLKENKVAYIDINDKTITCKSDNKCTLDDALNEAKNVNNVSVTVRITSDDEIVYPITFKNNNNGFTLTREGDSEVNVLVNGVYFFSSSSFTISNLIMKIITDPRNNTISQNGGSLIMSSVTIGGGETPVTISYSLIKIYGGGDATFNNVVIRQIQFYSLNNYGAAIDFDYSSLTGSGGGVPSQFNGLTLDENTIDSSISFIYYNRGIMILRFTDTQFTDSNDEEKIKIEIQSKLTIPKKYYNKVESVYYSLDSYNTKDLYFVPAFIGPFYLSNIKDSDKCGSLTEGCGLSSVLEVVNESNYEVILGTDGILKGESVVVSKEVDISKNGSYTLTIGNDEDFKGLEVKSNLSISSIDIIIAAQQKSTFISVSGLSNSIDIRGVFDRYMTIGSSVNGNSLNTLEDSLIKVSDGAAINLRYIIFKNIKLNGNKEKYTYGTVLNLDFSERTKFFDVELSNVNFEEISVGDYARGSRLYLIFSNEQITSSISPDPDLRNVKEEIQELYNLIDLSLQDVSEGLVYFEIKGNNPIEPGDLFIPEERDIIHYVDSNDKEDDDCSEDHPCSFITAVKKIDYDRKKITFTLKSNIEISDHYIFKGYDSNDFEMNNDESIHNISLKGAYFTGYRDFSIIGININLISKPSPTESVITQQVGNLVIKGDNSSNPIIIDGGSSLPSSVTLDKTLITICSGSTLTISDITIRNVKVLSGYSSVFDIDYSKEEDKNTLTTLTIESGVIIDINSLIVTDGGNKNRLILLRLTSEQIKGSNDEQRKESVRNKLFGLFPLSYFTNPEYIYYIIDDSSPSDLYSIPSELFIGGSDSTDNDYCIRLSSCESLTHALNKFNNIIKERTITVLDNNVLLKDACSLSSEGCSYIIKGDSSSVCVIDESVSDGCLIISVNALLSSLSFTFSHIPNTNFITVNGITVLTLNEIIFQKVSLTSSLIIIGDGTNKSILTTLTSVSFKDDDKETDTDTTIGKSLIIIKSGSSAFFTYLDVENINMEGDGAAISAVLSSDCSISFTTCIFYNVKTTRQTSKGGAMYIDIKGDSGFGAIDGLTSFEGCSSQGKGDNIYIVSTSDNNLKLSAEILKDVSLLIDEIVDIGKFVGQYTNSSEVSGTTMKDLTKYLDKIVYIGGDGNDNNDCSSLDMTNNNPNVGLCLTLERGFKQQKGMSDSIIRVEVNSTLTEEETELNEGLLYKLTSNGVNKATVTVDEGTLIVYKSLSISRIVFSITALMDSFINQKDGILTLQSVTLKASNRTNVRISNSLITSSSSTIVRDCEFNYINVTVGNKNGGVLHVELAKEKTITITNTKFNNIGTTGLGGAVYISYSNNNYGVFDNKNRFISCSSGEGKGNAYFILAPSDEELQNVADYFVECGMLNKDLNENDAYGKVNKEGEIEKSLRLYISYEDIMFIGENGKDDHNCSNIQSDGELCKTFDRVLNVHKGDPNIIIEIVDICTISSIVNIPSSDIDDKLYNIQSYNSRENLIFNKGSFSSNNNLKFYKLTLSIVTQSGTIINQLQKNLTLNNIIFESKDSLSPSHLTDSLLRISGHSHVILNDITVNNINFVGEWKYGVIMTVDYTSIEDDLNIITTNKVNVENSVIINGINNGGRYYYLIFNNKINGHPQKPSEVKKEIEFIQDFEDMQSIYYSLDGGSIAYALNKFTGPFYVCNNDDECGSESVDFCDISTALKIAKKDSSSSSIYIYIGTDNAVIKDNITLCFEEEINNYYFRKGIIEEGSITFGIKGSDSPSKGFYSEENVKIKEINIYIENIEEDKSIITISGENKQLYICGINHYYNEGDRTKGYVKIGGNKKNIDIYTSLISVINKAYIRLSYVILQFATLKGENKYGTGLSVDLYLKEEEEEEEESKIKEKVNEEGGRSANINMDIKSNVIFDNSLLTDSNSKARFIMLYIYNDYLDTNSYGLFGLTQEIKRISEINSKYYNESNQIYYKIMKSGIIYDFTPVLPENGNNLYVNGKEGLCTPSDSDHLFIECSSLCLATNEINKDNINIYIKTSSLNETENNIIENTVMIAKDESIGDNPVNINIQTGELTFLKFNNSEKTLTIKSIDFSISDINTPTVNIISHIDGNIIIISCSFSLLGDNYLINSIINSIKGSVTVSTSSFNNIKLSSGNGSVINSQCIVNITSSNFTQLIINEGNGGVIYSTGYLNISSSNFSLITLSSGDGGAIYTTDSIIINSSSFNNISSSPGNGGAINSIINNNNNIIIISTHFANCSAVNGNGGALHLDVKNNGSMTITGGERGETTFFGCSASSASSSSFSHNLFLNEAMTNGRGGAIYLKVDENPTHIEISSTIFGIKTEEKNKANDNGGYDIFIYAKNITYIFTLNNFPIFEDIDEDYEGAKGMGWEDNDVTDLLDLVHSYKDDDNNNTVIVIIVIIIGVVIIIIITIIIIVVLVVCILKRKKGESQSDKKEMEIEKEEKEEGGKK